MNKTPKFSNFEIFYAFFQFFRRTSSIGTLKRDCRERKCYLVDFSEKIIAVFEVKMSQIDTGNDKNPKLPVLKDFMHFSKFSTDFVSWNVEKGPQGKNVLSSMRRKKTNAILQTKTFRK